MKIFKRIMSFVMAIMLGVTLTACTEKTKTYSGHGMSITMSEGFTEKTLLTATYYLESTDALMIATMDDKETVEVYYASIDTLEEYADLIITNNALTDAEKVERNDYYYFTYEKTVSGTTYYYLATVQEEESNFWLIQFACSSNDKDEFNDKFLTWADTVTFDSEASK